MLHCSSPDLSLLAGAEKLAFVAIINAYFDESGKHKDHPVVTFCGVCAPVSKIQAFEDDCCLFSAHKFKLTHGRKQSRGKHSMSERVEEDEVGGRPQRRGDAALRLIGDDDFEAFGLRRDCFQEC